MRTSTVTYAKRAQGLFWKLNEKERSLKCESCFHAAATACKKHSNDGVGPYVCLILTWWCWCQRQTCVSDNRRLSLFPQPIDPEFFLLVHLFMLVMLELGVHGSGSKHWKAAWKLVVALPFYIWFSKFSFKAFQTQHRLSEVWMLLEQTRRKFLDEMADICGVMAFKGPKFVSPNVASPMLPIGAGADKIPGLLQGQLTWEWLPIILGPTN